MAANWAEALFRGVAQGDDIARRFGDRVEKRKASKIAATINQESSDKLFSTEDKGALGNWAWDKLGFGDPPKLTHKPGASPAAAPVSPERAQVSRGLNLPEVSPASEAEAIQETLPMAAIDVTPVNVVPRAASAPIVAAPQMSPVDRQPSALQKKMLEMGIS